MYGHVSWTTEKAEHWRIDVFELWCWRRPLKVPWTATRFNQSILKEISPEYSLKGLMLKLKLQYFGHLMQRTDSLEKILMLGKIESRRRWRTSTRNTNPQVTIIYQFSSVPQSCPTLCDPMDCSTPGLPVHHQLLEFTQTHVHWAGDAIQPSHPLLSPFPPALNLSQHQGLFKWVSSSHQAAKVLAFQLQHQSFQWTLRTDLL